MHSSTVQLLICGIISAFLKSCADGHVCHTICDENNWCTDVCPEAEQQLQQQQQHQLGYQGSYSQNNRFVPAPVPEPVYPVPGPEYPVPEPEYPVPEPGYPVPEPEHPVPEPQYLSSLNAPQAETRPGYSYDYDAVVPMPEPLISSPKSRCHLEKAPCQSRGVCKPQCALKEDILGRCPGLSCFCCAPQPICVALGTECSKGGVCRSNCQGDEVLVGSCMGVGCKCCSTNKKSKKV